MKLYRGITSAICAASFLWAASFPVAMASEPVRAASPKKPPLPPSQVSSIPIDGRPQTLTFVLGEEVNGDDYQYEGGTTKTCTATTTTGVAISYDCPGPDRYSKRRIHLVDFTNHVTLVIPEAASRFGPLDELLDVSQKNAVMFVSASKTSKRVLIYVEAKTDIQSIDKVNKTSEIVTALTVRLEDLAKVTRPVTEGTTEMNIRGRRFSYKIGRVDDPSLLQVNLTVRTEGYFLGKTLLVRTLASDEYVIEDEGERFSRVIVDLDKLHLIPAIRGREVTFEIATTLELPLEGLANSQDLPRLAMFVPWKTKLAKDWCLGCDE